VCVLASNNIRDIEDDRAVGKRTFPVRFGKTAAQVGVALILLASVAFAVLGFGTLWLLFLLVPDIFLYVKLLKAEGKAYNICLFRFVLLDVLYVVAFGVAFWL
ncbi:MAG: UbiA family prenyltransferase, partial [Bacteroidales bacterium]|nr:UbiA family prenyltransferase [Bacteroidales bacterium]